MYKKHEANMAMSSVLKICAGFSLVLMATGVALFLYKGGPKSLTEVIPVVDLTEALKGSARLEPVSLMTTGIIVLIAIPLVRVIGAFFSFWFIEKDKLYACISLGVLIILGASLFVPGIK